MQGLLSTFSEGPPMVIVSALQSGTRSTISMTMGFVSLDKAAFAGDRANLFERRETFNQGTNTG
jgi:hypothetical protein